MSNKKMYKKRKRGGQVKKPRGVQYTSTTTTTNIRTGGQIGKELKVVDHYLQQNYDGTNPTGTTPPNAIIYCYPDFADTKVLKNPHSQINCLNAVDRGSAYNQRIGQRISIVKIQIRGNITWPDLPHTSAGSYVPPTIFLALVLDKQASGAPPNPGTIYKAPTHQGMGAVPFRNTEWTKRFDVLVRKKIQIRIGGNSVYTDGGFTTGSVYPFEMFYEFKTPLITTFSQSSVNNVNVSAIADNALHLIANASHRHTDAVASTYAKLNYHCRVRFYG